MTQLPERRYRVPDARYKSGYRVTPYGRKMRLKWQLIAVAWLLLFLYGTSVHLLFPPVLGSAALLAYGGHRVRVKYRRPRPARGLAVVQSIGEVRARQPVPRTVKAAVWQRDGGRCRHCGITDAAATARTGVHLHYDHIVPFSRNGTDTVNNIQLLCEQCNLAKGNRYAG